MHKKHDSWIKCNSREETADNAANLEIKESDYVEYLTDELLLWKNNAFTRMMRFRPLIYFCVFGSEDQFKMLRLCLESLHLYSGVDSEILIITARQFETFITSQLGEMMSSKSNLHIRYISANNMEDFTGARYKVVELEEFADHCPVLYLDTDIICDSELLSLLKILRVSSGVSALSEGDLLDEREFWGRKLFLQDPTSVVEEKRRGFSTGVMGAATMKDLIIPFRSVIKSIELWKASGNAPFRVYDQPHANYVFIKAGFHNSETMKNHVRIVGNKHDADDTSRRGISHFAGGVGRNTPKLEKMASYLKKLADNSNFVEPIRE